MIYDLKKIVSAHLVWLIGSRNDKILTFSSLFYHKNSIKKKNYIRNGYRMLERDVEK